MESEVIPKFGNRPDGTPWVIPAIKNYSMALLIVRTYLGPTARLWRRDGKILAGTEAGGCRVVYGRGDCYRSAIEDILYLQAIKQAKANVEAAEKKAAEEAIEAEAARVK